MIFTLMLDLTGVAANIKLFKVNKKKTLEKDVKYIQN